MVKENISPWVPMQPQGQCRLGWAGAALRRGWTHSTVQVYHPLRKQSIGSVETRFNGMCLNSQAMTIFCGYRRRQKLCEASPSPLWPQRWPLTELCCSSCPPRWLCSTAETEGHRRTRSFVENAEREREWTTRSQRSWTPQPSADWKLPVVENLRDLPSGLVGPIAAQAAGAEGEGHAVGALHCGHTAIAVSRAAAVVPQPNGVLHPLLRCKELTVRLCILLKQVHHFLAKRQINHTRISKLIIYTVAIFLLLWNFNVPWVVLPCPGVSQRCHWVSRRCCRCPSPAPTTSTCENVPSPLGAPFAPVSERQTGLIEYSVKPFTERKV